MRRYEEAVKWDPNSAEGWYKLGEAQLKLGNRKNSARPGPNILDLEPDGKYSAAGQEETQSEVLACRFAHSSPNRRDELPTSFLPVRKQIDILHIPRDSLAESGIGQPHRQHENIVQRHSFGRPQARSGLRREIGRVSH